MLATIKTYPLLDPKEVRTIGPLAESGVEKSLLVVDTPFGYRRISQLLRPAGSGPFPVILYVHWFEPASPDSNRSQFVKEAKELAAQGVMCLAVETLWSDPDFFYKRTQAEDLKNSAEEVVNLRRFIDLLLSQPGADPKRFALVGHDFGGMYGVLAGSLDQRPTHYVIMAATPRFPDWYLYAPKLEGKARKSFIQSMAELDPIEHAAKLAPARLLFQFGKDDPHVPRGRADEFFAAARQPKERKDYDCGHGLNEEASRDRAAWLKKHLCL